MTGFVCSVQVCAAKNLVIIVSRAELWHVGLRNSKDGYRRACHWATLTASLLACRHHLTVLIGPAGVDPLSLPQSRVDCEPFLLKTELDEYQNLPDVRLAGCSINPQETSQEESGRGIARLAGTKHGEGRAAPMSRGAGKRGRLQADAHSSGSASGYARSFSSRPWFSRIFARQY